MFGITPETYDALLAEKVTRMQQVFQNHYTGAIQVFPSAKQHYRMRAEFRLWNQNNKMHYVMFEKGKNNAPIFISEFPQAHEAISELMFPLLEEINKHPLVAVRLFQIDFLCTKAGEVLVTLIYHKNLSDDWEEAARQLQTQFNIKIIGRARKQKRILVDDFVTETLNVIGVPRHYKQIENSFSQPNAGVCEKMIEWTLNNVNPSDDDLLELYCGNGNFTIPLAQNFRKVLATEVSKASIKAAKENCHLNAVDNITFARLSSVEIAQAIAGEREFRRLADVNLANYRFKTVFVDPPRAGLDEASIELVKNFESILYISCNPETLQQNLEQLTGYQVENMALFDQFPYTDHIECGAFLKRC